MSDKDTLTLGVCQTHLNQNRKYDYFTSLLTIVWIVSFKVEYNWTLHILLLFQNDSYFKKIIVHINFVLKTNSYFFKINWFKVIENS